MQLAEIAQNFVKHVSCDLFLFFLVSSFGYVLFYISLSRFEILFCADYTCCVLMINLILVSFLLNDYFVLRAC